MLQTGKIALIAGIVIIIAIVGYWLSKKVTAAKRIEIGSVGIRLAEKPTLKSIGSGLKLIVDVEIQNYSKTDIELNQIFVNAKTTKGNSIANQATPMAESVILANSANTVVSLPYNLDYTGILTVLRDSGKIKKISDALAVLSSFIQTKTFGIDIVLKGYIVAESIKVNIEETVTI